MAEGISQPLAANFLNVLRGQACDSPYGTGSFYVGLGKSLPPDTGDFAGIEFVGDGYARYNINSASAASAWVVSGRTAWNTQTQLFGPATVDWAEEVKSVGIFPSLAGTVPWFFMHLVTGQNCPQGNYVKFPPNRLKFTIEATNTGKSDELAAKQLSLLLGQSYSLPGNSIYIGLGTKPASQLGTGDIGELTSANAPGYARVQLPAATGTFTAPGLTRKISNLVEIKFQDATSNWELAKSFGIYTTATGGTPWYFGGFPPEKSILIRRDDNIIIPVAGLEVYE